jgi:multidrug resistance protein, MATE family
MTDIALATAARGRWAEEVRATVTLGWPIVLTNLAQIALGTTDVMILGWLGPEALAAGALGTNLFFAFTILGLGLSNAVSPMLAQALGHNRFAVRDLRRTVRQGLWATSALTVPIWAILWHAEPILLALGQRPELAAAAGGYMRTLQWSLLPFLWFMVLRGYISALERPSPGLVVTIFAIALNAVICWALVFGRLGLPAMGLPGAGIATTVASVFMFVALLGFIYWDRRFRRYRLLGRFWRPDWPRFREMLRIGAPISVTFAFEVTVFNAAVLLMGLIETDAVAAHSIAIQIASITFMVPMGIGQAATVRVGLAAGRGDPAGIARAGWVAIALGVGFMAAMALALISAPLLLTGLFLDTANPANARAVELALAFLAMAALFQIADGAQAVGAGALRGLKDTRVPMIFAALGYWGLSLPLGAVLAFEMGLGGVGIWIGLAAGLGIVATLMVVRWSRREAYGLVPA